MKRVLMGSLKHETASFVPGLAGIETFRRYHILEGEEVFSPKRGSGTETDGAIAVARESDVELIPTIEAFAGAAPPVKDEVFLQIRDRIFAGASEHRGRMDGVYLALHGAMCTDQREDPEGEVIAGVREIVGPDVPISVSFDMHCHFTDLKASYANSIVGYHTHPHVDFEDTGRRAMDILVKTMNGQANPVVAYRKLQMIASAEHHNTSRSPMGDIISRCKDMESGSDILGATVFATQPWMDVTELGWATVVVADGDRGLGQSSADELARMAWDRREQYLVYKTPVKEALQKALAQPGKPFVLSDSADSVTGGGYGDGNVLLKEMLAMGIDVPTLLTLTDAESVGACFAAGVGTEVELSVGGKMTPMFYSPARVTGQVKTLTDGRYYGELPHSPVNLGRTAVLAVGNIQILLSENPAPSIDQEAYRSAGLDPRQAKIVQVKSPGGFRAIYGPFAAGIFEIDTEGPTGSDLTRLPFQKIRRPLWPMDRNLDSPW